MEERLGEMRKGRRERIEVSSSPQGMISWSSTIKICLFFQAYRMHLKKEDMS